MNDPIGSIVTEPRTQPAFGKQSQAGLSTELSETAGRRLSWVALAYLIIFFVVSGQDVLRPLAGGASESIDIALLIRSSVAIAGALAVFRIGRTGRCPRGLTLPDVAVIFQVFATLVPSLADVSLTSLADMEMREIGRVLGFEGADFQTGFIEPLNDHGIRLGVTSRPTWLGIWILIYPLIFPMTFRRTLLSSLLTLAAGMGPILVPLLFTDIPEWMVPSLPAYVLGIAVPTLVCLGLALVSSRVIYRVSVDLARERRMGSYQLTEKIGEGGMGEVWRARHRFLARPAAIKLIRPDSLKTQASDSDVLLQRFEREAQATALLSSPHTVELYDFGVTEDGTFYYVMEFLKGLDLKSLVDRHGPVSAERAIFLLIQACHSLGDAHEAGLVHRDVKPANLFTCRQGPDLDWIKVLDFGLVKPVRESGRNEAQLTMTGTATGTPAFMPPEMAEEGRAIDGRADLYSLGCVAYWLVTGLLVFEAKDAMGMIIRHVRDEPTPPSRLAELDVPPALDAVILSCLAKNPSDRPETAWDLRDRLREVAADLPAWSEPRAEQWWGNHLPGEDG